MFLLLSMLDIVSAVIGKTDFSLSQGELNTFLWFGFFKGGEIELKVSAQSDGDLNFSIYICTPENYNIILQEDYGKEYCGTNNTNEFICRELKHFSQNHPIRNQYIRDIIEEYITYWFVVASCAEDSVEIKVNYEVTNPGGEQLSSGVLEIKYLALGFFIAWCGLLLIWIVKWIIVSRKRPNYIQIGLIVNCVIWGAFSAIIYWFLHDFSTGGKPSPVLLKASIWLFITAECCFFVVLQMISTGICIRNNKFEKLTGIKMVFNIVLIMICYMLYVIIGTLSFFVLSGAYVLLLIFYIYDVRKVIRGITLDMERMIDSGQEIIESPVWYQVRMYRTFMISLIIFLLGLGTISGIYIYYYYMPWIGVGAHIYIIFNSVLILSSYFRFQHDSPYWFSDPMRI